MGKIVDFFGVLDYGDVVAGIRIQLSQEAIVTLPWQLVIGPAKCVEYVLGTLVRA